MTAWTLMGLASAFLFGISTPLSKVLLRGLPTSGPFQLAGLLYLGAGISMVPFVLAGIRKRRAARTRNRANILRLAGAVFFGGFLGPVLLLAGLSFARASSVSLWLTLELAATAVIGVLFFKEKLGLRGWLGVGGAFAANVLIAAGEGTTGVLPALFVALACVCWGLDNNITSTIDGFTPVETTMAKGLCAGAANLLIGWAAAGSLPGPGFYLPALALGAVSYGGSIVLYINAAQRTGAARGQVLFAAAPFFGTLMSFLLLAEKPALIHLAAIPLLAAAILLMLGGKHDHPHVHGRITHIHAHRHDDPHHAHAHPGMPPGLSHTHEHTHEELEHEHPHLPDLHHRHPHT